MQRARRLRLSESDRRRVAVGRRLRRRSRRPMHDGRIAAMPAWGPALGDSGTADMAQYVLSVCPARRTTRRPRRARAPQFQTFCVACHGPDGKGNPAARRARPDERRLAVRRRRRRDRVHDPQRPQRHDAAFRADARRRPHRHRRRVRVGACDADDTAARDRRLDHRNAMRTRPRASRRVDLYQRREKIFTRAIEGRFQRIRLYSGWPLLIGYLVLPWLDWGGRQAVLFDLADAALLRLRRSRSGRRTSCCSRGC